jgi:hypothetical protein
MIGLFSGKLKRAPESIEAGGFDDDVTAAVTIQEYGARIAALEQLVGS